MTVSVVIPAHDEAAVIERCLRALTSGAAPGDLDIVVVCNGCSDRTAEIARRFPYAVRVEETEVASKAHALNLGDRASRGFPRVYLDADVVVSREAVHAVAEALRSGDCLAAAPRMQVDLARASPAVRAYYRVWLALPYHRQQLIGSGFYALSEPGRARFGEFPPAIGDDAYVRMLFAPGERRSLSGNTFTVFAPASLRELLGIKTRARLGRIELADRFPELRGADRKPLSSTLGALLADPALWPRAPLYYAITLATILSARGRWKRRELQWDRDESSRGGAPPA